MYKYRSTTTDDPPSLHPFQPNLFPSIARRTNVMLAFTNSASLILIIRGYFHLCIPSIHPIHPWLQQSNVVFLPLCTNGHLYSPTTYYPPMAGACHCYAPNPTLGANHLGFYYVRNKQPWVVFFFASASQSGKAEASPTNSSFIDFNNTDILLLLSSSRFSFLVFLSFFPRSNQTLSVLFSYRYTDAYHLGNVAPLWWVGW
jgi:hypothetical protein